jgi:hypothetical protein
MRMRERSPSTMQYAMALSLLYTGNKAKFFDLHTSNQVTYV